MTIFLVKNKCNGFVRSYCLRQNLCRILEPNKFLKFAAIYSSNKNMKSISILIILAIALLCVQARALEPLNQEYMDFEQRIVNIKQAFLNSVREMAIKFASYI